MKTIFTFLKPYKLPMAAALSLMLIELAVELAQPLLMAKIIDDGIMERDMHVIIIWGAVMMAASILAFAAGITNSFLAAHSSQNFGFDIRKHLFEKVQSFSFANFNTFSNASLITRMTNDVNQLQNTLFMSLRIAIRAPLLVIGGIVMAFLVNVKLALIFAIIVPPLIIFLVWAMKKAAGLFGNVQKRLDKVNGVMRENLTGMRLIKAFARGEHEENRFEESNQNLMAGTVKALRLTETTIPILLFVMNLGVIVVLWYGAAEINTGGIQVGELVAIVNYAARITTAFSMFSFIIMVFSRAGASARRISEVFEEDVDLKDSGDMISNKGMNGQIEFRSVSFHYPESTIPVLKDISFKVNSGQTVALMGATGSGKTSLFQLIPRLYDVTAGEVLVDGQDVRDIPLETLRMQLGYVPQEALLFTGSVKSNIVWGKENATDEDVKTAAENAQIHETIEKLPEKYHTLLGQRGVNLSGGQKQRLSIARALVRRPKILLLDDSTSALDLKTERKLLAALKGYTCTTFIITQKISTAMKTDKILLIDDGSLLAEGSPQELMKNSDLYRDIYQSQFGKESAN
ncbi:ABC transporter ATP-binding protein [Mesobacillus harenae]|uniref:ABC transporter ATP-binding protein n=1 Tax=Mesobacillus harenae TaxID=2213203 RepID=UPI0015801678|nr:ABC transporter ATP-binding protein [Mesobacillus harenae]